MAEASGAGSLSSGDHIAVSAFANAFANAVRQTLLTSNPLSAGSDTAGPSSSGSQTQGL